MTIFNGRLPRATLAPITKAINGEQAYLRRDAAKAFMAMNAESEARFGITLRVPSARTAYRPYADQLYFWNLYLSGKGNLAARPGTSNHGWGLAVDLATQVMRTIVDKIGARYGWAKKWSDAPSEWWHLMYHSGVWDGLAPYLTPPSLHRGQTGPSVLKLKKALRAKGVKGFNAYTPFFDQKTEAAVRRFQIYHHLAGDGKVGPKTWALLR